ncbi:DUF3857 and transglutaminase domain-containing protein [Trinickia fusca]
MDAMRCRSQPLALAVLVACCAGLPAQGSAAQSVPARASTDELPPATIESDVHRFVVQHDGTVAEEDDTILRANTPTGVDAVAERYVWFNKDVETIDTFTAESIDPDGHAHPVGSDAIRDVQEPRSLGAPVFEDGVLRTAIFPGIEPGWRVHLTFRKTRTKPALRGMFEYYVQPTREPVDSQKLIFDLPADMPLYADARGYVAREPMTEHGRTRYEFDYRHGAYAPLEPGSVSYAQYGDRLMVSTMPSFAAFAARYRDAAVDVSAGDPAVVALARALTADAPDTWTKARVLYDWMRENVRYVALFLGETAAVPHRVIDVLRNRYGDCKDHVALYGALLAAVGVRSEPALIGLGGVYALPSVAGYGASAINHVIVWIPELQIFADTTAGGVAFGYLPPGVMDRPALLVDDGVLVRTPAAEPRSRTARLQIGIDTGGAAQFAYRVTDSGWTAELERNVFRRATRERRLQLANERLRETGMHGVADIETGDTDATTGPFTVSMTGALDHLAWPDGMTAWPALSSLAGGIASQLGGWLAVPERTQPYVCEDGNFDETGEFSLPSNLKAVYVPPDVTVRDDVFDYAAHYVYDPATRTVQVTRHLRASFGKAVCTPEEFAAARGVLERMARDASSQIVVQGAAR